MSAFDPAEPEVKTLMEQKAQEQGAAERTRIGKRPKMFSPIPSKDPATAILDEQDEQEAEDDPKLASGGVVSSGYTFHFSPQSFLSNVWADPAPQTPLEPKRVMPSHDELQSKLDAFAESLGAIEVRVEGTVKSRRYVNDYGPHRGERGELVLKIKVVF